MRILHVIDKMEPRLGGVCQAVRMLIAGLEQKGVYNEVVSLDESKNDFSRKDSFAIHCLGAGKGPWKRNRKLIPWLVDKLDRFDAVVVHGLWLYHTYAVRRASKIYRSRNRAKNPSPKFFVMPHGMLDPYFQKAAGRKLKALRNWVYWKLLEEKSINNAEGLFFTCKSEQALARIPFQPYHPKKEFVIGLGIEQPPIYTVNMRTAFLKHCPAVANEKYLLFLSRIHEKKGVDVLVEAYTKLIVSRQQAASGGQRETDNLKLVIAGPGFESSYGKRIKAMIADRALEDEILCSDMLSGDAKWGAFYGAEAFVLPSYQENFGIAVVEALACGKPVLISKHVNIYSEIESAEAGIISDNTTEEVFHALYRWQYMDATEKYKTGQKAYNLFEQEFAIDSTIKKMLHAVNFS